MFSNEDKLRELRRELGMRKHVYPGLVASKQMSLAQQKFRIELIEEMIADYEALASKERLL